MEDNTDRRVFVDEARVMNHFCKPNQRLRRLVLLLTRSKGEFKPSVTKKASTMPRNTVCVSAIDMRRNTRDTPGIAHAMDTAMAMSKISVINSHNEVALSALYIFVVNHGLILAVSDNACFDCLFLRYVGHDVLLGAKNETQ